MADTKISGLSAVTSLVGTDEFVLARTGTTKKITAANMLSSTDGWTSDSATWTYASASTFTVTGDVTAKFSKGTRLKFTQTTDKYAVVVASSHAAGTTTVTIAVNTDYTIANAAITVPYFSYQLNPQGYPGWFTYTPSWTGATTNPVLNNGTMVGKFSINGTLCMAQVGITIGSTTTFGSGIYTITLPVTEDTAAGFVAGNGLGYDSSAGGFYPAHWRAGAIYQLATVPSTFWSATVPFTWAVNDGINLSELYRI